MKRAIMLSVLAVAACNVQKDVKVTFGETGEGLDGFMCKDDNKLLLLERLAPSDGGTYRTTASLVTDFITLGGLPDGCRSSQLIKWCATHACAPAPNTRVCTPFELPAPDGGSRANLRAAILEKFKAIKDKIVSENAPDGPVMMRVLATAEPCSAVMAGANGTLPAYAKSKLVGCAYSCPTLFDQVGQDVLLSFDTLTEQCEQGVRTCSENDLHWQP